MKLAGRATVLGRPFDSTDEAKGRDKGYPEITRPNEGEVRTAEKKNGVNG